MPFEFLSNLDTTTTFLLLIIFILFVLAMKKIMGILKNAVIIAFAAVLFPIVMNRFFGYDIPMDPDSIVSFILLGLGVYFVYLIAKAIYSMLKLAERFAKEKVPKIERPAKEKEEKEEKTGKKDKKREKELEEKERELEKREQELRWKEKIESKKRRDWTKEYHVLEDKEQKKKAGEEKEINVSKSYVTPLPVIGEEDEEEKELEEEPKKARKKKKSRRKG
ncbi:MAG: hypothetical protein HY517_02360 [Candidatus Aenigmarchaeota archaeon]|nr:hypothetical protein [Candidatus Aenigmarchaeota archaeon]